MASLWLVLFLCICKLSTSTDPPVNRAAFHESHHFDHEYDHNPQQEDERNPLRKEPGRSHSKPSESQTRRVRSLFGEVDINKDSIATQHELVTWLRKAQRKWERLEARKELKKHDANRDGFLSKGEYEKLYDKNVAPWLEDRKMKRADINSDGRLDSDEVGAIIFPRSYPRMKALDALALAESFDENRDEIITLEEYLGSFSLESKTKNGKEAKWVSEERSYFRSSLDKNNDDKLEVEEIIDWMLPPDDEEDVHEIEVKEILERADSNEDGQLTEDEILEKYDVFIQSHATDFGEYLARDDDEPSEHREL